MQGWVDMGLKYEGGFSIGAGSFASSRASQELGYVVGTIGEHEFGRFIQYGATMISKK